MDRAYSDVTNFMSQQNTRYGYDDLNRTVRTVYYTRKYDRESTWLRTDVIQV